MAIIGTTNLSSSESPTGFLSTNLPNLSPIDQKPKIVDLTNIPTLSPTFTPAPAKEVKSWKQIDQSLAGQGAGDVFGDALAISSDGTRVIAGAPYNDDSGHVRVLDMI